MAKHKPMIQSQRYLSFLGNIINKINPLLPKSDL